MFRERKDGGLPHEKAKVEAIVEVEQTILHHRKGDLFQVECHLIFPYKDLTAKAVTEDMKTSVIQAREELQRQITDYKDKLIERSRRPQ